MLIDFVGAWIHSVNMELGGDWKREDLRLEGWDMAAHASEIVGCHWLNDWFRQHIGYWMDADTTKGAVKCINRLSENFDIEIVTNKPDWARVVVWDWLHWHNPNVFRVTVTDHFAKHEVSNADILIDDRPDTVRRWIDSRPGRYGILFDRSQNRDDRSGLLVARDMIEVEKQVKTIDKIINTRRPTRV